MEREAIYKEGDKVKIIKYGSPLFGSKNESYLKSLPVIKEYENCTSYDLSPELVGQCGTITKATVTQGIPQYSISGVSGKTAWYDEEQLELVTE